MGRRKRKQNNPEEPDNKKSAKLQTEEGGGSDPEEVEEATQNMTVVVVPKKNEKQEVQKEKEDLKEPKKEDEDMKELKKEQGNGSQSSRKKKKKKNKANKASNEPKKDQIVKANNGFVDDCVFTQEDAEKFMGTLSKEDLELILKSALKKHGDIINDIANVANKDQSKRKLFVRGLGRETKSETLKSVFSAYGEVENAQIVMDKISGKCKGFGFVTFKSLTAALAAVKEPIKNIDGRKAICNISTGGAPAPDPQPVNARKIYVGGLPSDVDSDKLVELFSQYGEIEEGPLGFDKKTGKCKGFAFFIYKSEKSAKSAMIEPRKTLDGVTLICKPASPRDKNGTPSNLDQGNMWAYGSPLTGFIPVENLGTPFLQQALLKKRARHLHS